MAEVILHIYDGDKFIKTVPEKDVLIRDPERRDATIVGDSVVIDGEERVIKSTYGSTFKSNGEDHHIKVWLEELKQKDIEG